MPHRSSLWQSLPVPEYLSQVYPSLLSLPTPYLSLIERDITRTFPSLLNSSDQSSLLNLARAYSLYDDEIGYCQGMLFLLAILLLHLRDPSLSPLENETKVFNIFLTIMERWEMRDLYRKNMQGVHLRMFQLRELVRERVEGVVEHIEGMGVSLTMFASQWILTLFSYGWEVDWVAKVWDSMFENGCWEVVMNVSVALLQENQANIIGKSSFEDLYSLLSEGLLSAFDDVDDLLLKSTQIGITTAHLRGLQEAFMAQNNQFEECELVVDSNGVLCIKLKEENELLKMQVQELKDIIKQAQKERILPGLVHEEEGDSQKFRWMEMELIDMKLKYAESESARHQLLKENDELKRGVIVRRRRESETVRRPSAVNEVLSEKDVERLQQASDKFNQNRRGSLWSKFFP